VVDWLKHLPGMNLLARAWQQLRDWLAGLNQQIENLREARRRAQQPATRRSAHAFRRWINPRKLSPRQQVQFYYLAMLRRGGEHGHARQPAQTPYEYARALERQIPEIDQDVDGLTEEFIEARYSRHDIPPEHVGLVRRYWERIKRALRLNLLKSDMGRPCIRRPSAGSARTRAIAGCTWDVPPCRQSSRC
jgi:hypothetical protein